MISSSNDHFRWVGSKSCMAFGNISDMDFRFIVIFVSFFFLRFWFIFVKPGWAGHYLCAGGLGQEFLSRWQNVRPQLGRNKSSSGSWNQFQGRLLQDGQDRIGQDGLRQDQSWVTAANTQLSWPYSGGTCILWGEKARSYTLKSLKFPPCLVSWFSSAWKMPLLQDLVEASRLCKYCSLDSKIDEIVSQDYLLLALGDPSLALSQELGTFGLLRPKGHVEKRAWTGWFCCLQSCV